MDKLAGIDLKALAKVDAKLEKANERLASAARANRARTRSMRELTIEEQITNLRRERHAITGGVMVAFVRGEYRAPLIDPRHRHRHPEGTPMILNTPEIREAITYRDSLPIGSPDREDAFHDVRAAVAAANSAAADLAVDLATLKVLSGGAR